MALMLRAVRRQFSTSVIRNSAQESSGHDGGVMWRNLSLFVGFPVIGLCMINAFLDHQKHAGHERPPFVAYEHLRIRNKPFPWGDGKKSLFHNPHTNALPDGYEDEL
ncbi:unnamed protein product [Cyprideis torosa]|uniref:Cytochrome c oxidase subunit n=1 Tax=Cyprideis torosa TaxID=163714 RepID=A0A7R8ZM61_9CRUS|nr:unnamed protein product [Cyprideis torosa]CAG0888174.1 unnamed protein product [Cyprideis torosa]